MGGWGLWVAGAASRELITKFADEEISMEADSHTVNPEEFACSII